jgi:hypothetical protein
VCVFITALPILKLFARGEGDSHGGLRGHVLSSPSDKKCFPQEIKMCEITGRAATNLDSTRAASKRFMAYSPPGSPPGFPRESHESLALVLESAGLLPVVKTDSSSCLTTFTLAAG